MNNTKHPPLWSALTSYIIGFLWICCFLMGFWELNFDRHYKHLYPLLFAAVFFLWAGFTLRDKQGHREHRFWLACALLIALALACKRGRAVDAWAHIALHGFAAYWVLCRSGLLADSETGIFLPLDLVTAGAALPFGSFFLRLSTLATQIRTAVTSRKSTGSRKNTVITLLVILGALPFLILAGNLLGQADESFRHLLSSFFSFRWDPPRWVGEVWGRFFLGLPVGAYLFGLVGGCFRREKPVLEAGKLRDGLKHLHLAPTAALATVLGSFCALYLLFFAVQARHLIGAFFGNVPGTLTAAQYAREGFFQLCMVMAINFGLLGASMAISQTPLRQQRVLRILADVLMVQSILLAITAASKLILYIHRFGFTPLRLLSMWGILVLAAGSLLALGSLRGRPKAIKHWVFFSAATFTILCFY